MLLRLLLKTAENVTATFEETELCFSTIAYSSVTAVAMLCPLHLSSQGKAYYRFRFLDFARNDMGTTVTLSAVERSFGLD